MTPRERAEQFMDRMYERAKITRSVYWEEQTPLLAAEFDAVAREAAAQMQERCEKTVLTHQESWMGEDDYPMLIAEQIRALPLSDDAGSGRASPEA